MRILAVDTEVSGHNTGETAVGKFPACPWHADNWPVWFGWKELRDDLSVMKATRTLKFPDKQATIPAPKLDDKVLIVGHNIKYDLEVLCGPGNTARADWIEAINHPNLLVWDTMQAEFRLRGQSQVNPSLDWCCEYRDWEVKPGRLKEYWSNGISTEDIPDEEVDPYLHHDVDSAAALFVDQVNEARERGMLPLMRMEMEAVLATTVMETNGMRFDHVGALHHLHSELEGKVEALRLEVQGLFAKNVPIPEDLINPNSNPFLTAYLYGGTVKYKLQEPQYEPDGTAVLFKSGKRKGEHKHKWVTHEVELPQRVKTRMTSVDEDTLMKLKASKKLSPDDAVLMDKLLRLRELTKEAKTYYKGYSALTWPDGLIRGNLNHAIAATTRLSSSAPNLQNAAHGRIREHFISRYVGGHLLEVDLSQIEVVVQAFLSQDENMIADILAGTDFHSKRAAFANGVSYEEVLAAYKAEDPHWTKERKHAKIFSFQRAYGAGAPLIADFLGIEKSRVEALIEAEEAMYPGVVEYQERCIEEVKKSTAQRDGKVCGALVSPTKGEYRFFRESHRGELTYKPTMIKNYPVQGLAGEILKLILARLRKWLYWFNRNNHNIDKDDVLMVMTVHDSVVLDVPAWVDVPALARDLIHLFVTVNEDLDQMFGIEFNIPIKADAEFGTNWYEMKAAA